MTESASQQIWYYTMGRRIPVAVIVFLVLGLHALGLLMLSSIGRVQSEVLGGYFFRQTLWSCIALSGFGIAVLVDFRVYRKLAWFAGLAGLALLVLVKIPEIGVEVNGARRWIDLGPMNLQVSDPARLSLLIVLAAYFGRYQRNLDHVYKGFIQPAILAGVAVFLVLLQPDFGTAFLFAAVSGCLFFLAGVRLKYLLPTAVSGLVLFCVAVVRDPIRLDRIMSFIDVKANRGDGTYQLWQGLIGFGVGGIDGVGLGNGRQPFAFLPEAHTDFIFPVIGEELGLLCTALVAGGYAVFFCVGWQQLRKAPNLYESLLVSGALFFLTFQALINMGVTTGLLPTKGMSLPFVSYGGSNLVVSYFMLGIIVRAFWRWNDPPEFTPSEIKN